MFIPVATKIEHPKPQPKSSNRYQFQKEINENGEETFTATPLNQVPIAKVQGYMEVTENKKKQSITQKLKETLQWLIPCYRLNQRIHHISS